VCVVCGVCVCVGVVGVRCAWLAWIDFTELWHCNACGLSGVSRSSCMPAALTSRTSPVEVWMACTCVGWLTHSWAVGSWCFMCLWWILFLTHLD